MELLQIVLTVKSRYLFWKTDPNDKLVSGVTNPELHVCDIFVFVMPYPPRFMGLQALEISKTFVIGVGGPASRVIGTVVVLSLFDYSREH